jgi:UrcA family protein
MKTRLFCGAMLALAFSTTATAEVRPAIENPELRQTSVGYADLDLSRPAGADVMIGRVRRAARAVCRDDLFPERARVRQIHACVRTAMMDALEQLDEPFVAARFLKTVHRTELAAR